MKIPSNKQWTQDTSGDTFGILGATQNMSLDTMGKAILSRKAVAVMDSQADADFEHVMAIVYYDSTYYVVTSGGVFLGSIDGVNYSEEVDFTPVTTLSTDAVIFNSLLVVSIDDNLASWDGAGNDVYTRASLVSGVPHPMCVFGTQLAIGDGNNVNLYNTSWTKNSVVLTLPTEYQVTTIRSRNDYIYVGTRNINGGEARIFVWDGDTSLYNFEVPVGASWIFSMTEYKNTVAAITSQGQLGYVSGNEFAELSTLPVYHNPHARWQGSGGLTLNGKVFNRGMITVGDTIYLNIEGEVDTGYVPEMKSGIWVYDPAVGLYHRSASSTDRTVEDGGLTRNGDVLTTSVAHGLKTGDGIVFESVSGLTGVNARVTYYVTVISSTEVKLSQSRKAVNAGKYVTLGGTPNSGDDFVYTPNVDFGANSATSGAIAQTVYNETPLSIFSSEVIWGSKISLPNGTVNYSLNVFCDQYNIGSFTTQRIYSENLDQSWKNLNNFIDGLSVSTESVVVKAQTIFDEPTKELRGVWLDSNTINSNSANDFTAFSDIEVGYELVIVDGNGRGRTVHVTEVDTSSLTVSLTVDESIGTANQTMNFYYTSFKKVGQALTLDNKVKEKVQSVIDSTSSPWIALKIELRGFAPAVNMMELSNVIQSKSN